MNNKRGVTIKIEGCRTEELFTAIEYVKSSPLFIECMKKNKENIDLIKINSKKYQIDESFLFGAVKKFYELGLGVEIGILASNLTHKTMFDFIITNYGYSQTNMELFRYFNGYLLENEFSIKEPIYFDIPEFKEVEKPKDWYRKFDNKQRFQKGRK